MTAASSTFRPPPLVPSVLIRMGIRRWYEQAISRGGFPSVLMQAGIFYLVLVNAGPFIFDSLSLALLFLLLGVGGRRVWRTYKGLDPAVGRFDSARQLACLTLFGFTVGTMLREVGWAWVACLLIVGIMEMLTRPPKGVSTAAWWSHERMARALISAKILSSPGRDSEGKELLPKLRFLGRPQTSDIGVSQTYELPEGITWEQVMNKHAALASAMRLPIQRLHIEHDDDQPACAVTITVLNPLPTGMRAADIPESTVWEDGIPIGPDRLGQPVIMQTVGAHTLFVAQTGAGKTCLGRYGAAWGTLDPNLSIFMMDGKDDLDDWRPMQHLCEQFVGGATHASAKAAEQMLLRIERISAERGTEGRGHAPILVVIDEWKRIRDAAYRHDPSLAKRLDSLIVELAATVRSRNISMWVFAQRGTEGFIPTDLRANLTQRIVGMTYEVSEVRYVLDKTPAVLPAKRGQFLFGSDRMNATLAMVPHFDDEDFKRTISRAALLRRSVDRPVLEAVSTPSPLAPPDSLDWAVLDALSDGPLQASRLFLDLPERVRPSSPVALGKHLHKMQGAGLVVRARIGKSTAWGLPETLRPTLRAVGPDPSPEAVSGGFWPSIHAHEDYGRPHLENPATCSEVMP